MWEQANATYSLFEEYKITSDNILQVVSLLSGNRCKISDLIDISSGDINTWWNKAIEGMDEAIRLLRDECGVLTGKWVPYGTMLVTLAIVCAKTTATGPAKAMRLEKMKRWFWCAVFSQAYEKSANSQIDKDHKELADWINGDVEPDSVKNYKRSPLTLRETAETQRGLYRGVMALTLSERTLDFYTKSPLTAAIISSGKVDDHHIFPKECKAIKDGKFPAKLVNCIINRTLIDASTNRSIGKNNPSAYLDAMDAAGVKVTPILDSHSLPSGKLDPLWSDNFDNFLDWREKEIEGLIKTATS